MLVSGQPHLGVSHVATRDKLGTSYRREGMSMPSGKLLDHVKKVHRSVINTDVN
eukprot:COSAG06_NODE_1915_length_8072_cov_15.416405_2_plen_54_part_00